MNSGSVEKSAAGGSNIPPLERRTLAPVLSSVAVSVADDSMLNAHVHGADYRMKCVCMLSLLQKVEVRLDGNIRSKIPEVVPLRFLSKVPKYLHIYRLQRELVHHTRYYVDTYVLSLEEGNTPT